MGAHRLFPVLIVAVGTATALLGMAIVTVAALVRSRAASPRRQDPSFDG